MKIFFTILDHMVAVLMGTSTLCLVSLVVNEGWNMFVAMIVGMILGMLVLAVIAFVFGPVCSLFQLFPSGMVITKLTGMAAGMLFAAGNACFMSMFLASVAFSLFVQFAIDFYNMKLKGEVIVNE